jgi:nitrilase
VNVFPTRAVLAYRPILIDIYPFALVYYDLNASLEKAISLIKEAASNGASLVVFPEAYLPGYPFHIWLEPYASWLSRTEHYYANCPTADGPECKTLEALAKALDITIVMGCAEKEHGSLYLSQWIVAPEGLIAQRRKLKPTLLER